MVGIEPNGAVLLEKTPASQTPVQAEAPMRKETPAEQKMDVPASQKPVQDEPIMTEEPPAEQNLALTANHKGADISKSATAVSQDSLKEQPLAGPKAGEAKPDQPASQLQANEPKESVTKIPTLSPEVGELAKQAEASMAVAVDEELEGTH